MQPDLITIPVDTANTGTTTDLTLKRVEEHLHRSVYITPDHLPDARDTCTLYRTPIKKTSTSRGVMKTAFKFSTDVIVGSPSGEDVDAVLIGEVNFSVPVGVTAATMLLLRQRIIALLDDDTIMDDLMRLQVV